MSIEVKVSVEKGNSRLIKVEKEKPTLVALRAKIMATNWGKELGSDFCFLKKGDEITPEDESEYQLSAFKKNDDIEVVVRRQEHSDAKKKTDKESKSEAKDSKSEAKGFKEEPEKTSTKQKSSQAQLKPEEKLTWEKAPDNDLIKDKGSYESKDKAYYDNLNPAEKAHLLKRLELPHALKLTLSDGLKDVNEPGYELSPKITEENFKHISIESIDKNETCFTSLEKKAYEMLSDNVKVSLKLSIPQLSAAFGLDVHHETTSETQRQSKNTKLFMVAKRIIPKIKVIIKEQTIQLTDEFKNSVAKADDIGKLREVFNKYGYFIPTAYIIGGSMIVVKEENVSANDQRSASSNNFGLKVEAELNKAGVAAEGSVGYNNEKKSQSSETSVLSDSRYKKNVKGGDQSLVHDPAKWVSTLTFDKWAIVEYEGLKPITDFLPQDLKEKCKKLLTPEPLSKLTEVVAKDIKEMAEWAAWYRVNTLSKELHKGNTDQERIFTADIDNCKLQWKERYNNLKKKAESGEIRLSQNTLENIRDGALSVALYTAKERVAINHDEAKKAWEEFEKHFESVKNSNEVTEELAKNIKEMCWFAAWHKANDRAGRKDKEDDKKYLDRYYRLIWE